MLVGGIGTSRAIINEEALQAHHVISLHIFTTQYSLLNEGVNVTKESTHCRSDGGQIDGKLGSYLEELFEALS